jgi:dolichyl-phosphate beta-glucosyltransferase
MINSLSIVFPVYNESKRLYLAFSNIKKFNLIHSIKKIEYIFVDDGSDDKTVEIIDKYIIKNLNNKNITYRVIKLKNNNGKGEALKRGVLSSKFSWVLTLDIDISVSLNQLIIWKNKKYLKKKKKIYFGSRNLKGSMIDYKLYRKILGIFFNNFISYYFSIVLKDTQCGFKLYESKTAKKIFKKLKDKGFAHDIEIILLAKKNNFDILELPVKWTHRNNSKLNIFFDTFKMLINLIKIKNKLN